MAIRLIVGLGNPGRAHSRDRHNVGFWFVDRLAAREGTSLRLEPRYHGLVARVSTRDGELWLLEPQTYMNVSGRAVGALARFYKLAPEELLVVHDELDFPPGVARLKLGGGVAGHNGLRDIHANLGTQGFWRLRIGIGHPGDRTRVSGYVLSPPMPEEREAIEAQVERALDVVPLLVAGDFNRAMQQLHPTEKKSKDAPEAKPRAGTNASRAGAEREASGGDDN